jgi:glutamate-1-semialdehyde 2,1-aminomutase
LATLHEIAQPGFYERLEILSARWENDLREALSASSLPVQINRVGSMMTVFFTDQPVRNFESAIRCDTKVFGTFFQGSLAAGLYLAPSQFEAGFLSIAHDDEVLSRTAEATKKAVKGLIPV